MTSISVQTACSIPTYDELSHTQENDVICGAAIAKHLRQPRGADFVPYLGNEFMNGANVVGGGYSGTVAHIVAANHSTLVFPSEGRSQQNLQSSQSPFRVSGEEQLRANTPLRDGPGPLHLHSPGLSPIVHKVPDKENLVMGQDSIDQKGREKPSPSSEGIAYRQALRELDNMPSNSKSHMKKGKQAPPLGNENNESRDNEADRLEEESKLLSMEVLNDTTLTNAAEGARAFNLPTHHQLVGNSHHYHGDQHQDSSLEVMSLLVDQSSSMSTPQRDAHSHSRKPAARGRGEADDSLAFISPLKASALKETPQHSRGKPPASGSGSTLIHTLPQPQPVAFGIDIDGRTGSPVIVPLSGFKASPAPAAVPLYGRSAGPSSASSFSSSSASAWAFGGAQSKAGGLMSSGFWKERMNRRTMSSVLSSPAAAAAL